jgi:hypothetical protein
MADECHSLGLPVASQAAGSPDAQSRMAGFGAKEFVLTGSPEVQTLQTL